MQPQPDPPERPSGSDLCLACGLCCTGLFFDVAPLEERELPLAGKLRLNVVRTPILDAFRLPCPRQEGTRCTVYEDRPTVCGSYACGLLRRFQAGEVELQEALDAVATIRGRVEALRRRVPAGSPPRPIQDDVRAYLAAGDAGADDSPTWQAARDDVARALTELRGACRREIDP